MDRSELEAKVLAVVAAALDREPSRVHLDDSLVLDLGAESIDFLDLRFRLESAFGLRLPEEELYRGAVIDPADPLLVDDRGLTVEGRRRLAAASPGLRLDERFPRGVRREDLPALITVRTLVEHVAARLAVADAAPPAA